ncbi:MAG: DUF937 domain-containing protein [Rhizobiaceae bacterium]
MIPLDEMLMKAQNGAAIDMVSRQFDLTRDQTVAAMEALLPAFSQGLKRTAATPQGIAPFLQALSSGSHAQYMENMTQAFSPAGMADGNGILGHLFGSKEVSRAVADHAARATGIGQDILKQMLPALASMLMGGLFQQSTGRMNAASGGGFGAGGNIIGEVIEQMMRQGQPMGSGRARPQDDYREERRREAPQPDPFDNPFGKILQDMFGGGPGGMPGMPTGRRQQPQMPGGDNPLGRIFEDMLSGGMGMPQGRGGDGGGHQHRREPEPEPQPQSQPRERQQRNPYEDLFGQMFETGRKAQDDYQRGVESIFDQFLKGMDRGR